MELELLAVVWWLGNSELFYTENSLLVYQPPGPRAPDKKYWCDKHYSAKLSRWLDRLAHFDIAIQHIAGSNWKFTDSLSQNPVGRAVPKDKYVEKYVTNRLSEQAKLNLKSG